MDLGLRGKRALITGGSKGIGLAIARALVTEGVAVGLVARDAGTLKAAAEQLAAPDATSIGSGSAAATIATHAADVTDTAALGTAVDAIAGSLGGLDLLVANVGGVAGTGNLTSAGAGDFTATFALNAGHAAELIRLGLPHLKAAGGGSVVIISSVTGMRPAPRTAYAAAKAAEIHLAATAAQELAPDRIRVNAVSPGSIMFPGGGWEAFGRQHPEDFAAFEATQFPFGRLGTPKEVAEVVAFLLSARASWISGANIPVDGAQIYPSARRFD
jgi:3-oxoacyl-[acyl-carrier protein] reductase